MDVGSGEVVCATRAVGVERVDGWDVLRAWLGAGGDLDDFDAGRTGARGRGGAGVVGVASAAEGIEGVGIAVVVRGAT